MADPHRLIGVWQLVRLEVRTADGELRPPGYGGMPVGLLSFDRAGRMMAMVSDANPRADTASPREHNSYCGSFQLRGETMVTRVDGGNRREWIGSKQVRTVCFEGGHLVLMPPPEERAGETIERRFVWRQIVSE